ncbi:MAG: hypothetical protein A2X25_08195 [Chloroflexi bacterium GWB2_49_20]|nr:MAG: hypothetical protein A2X25_08195 [Chloroflexi bacterium GWB2_49_20]OGN79583.1 MAG: hypothetical protein A2X26_05830 [Chloroflexi bacterium GWC2_49_37]OGN84494.1 MAG: hypothetical protein A2X27_10700 [Chloroflexi bacterium GWD2_49_16]HBG74083.1 hypothetical protein [Anaerolineae bacterium]HCC78885.1 hypothetical protein [Anaerolineae bacterium]
MGKNVSPNYKVILGSLFLAGFLLCTTFIYILWISPNLSMPQPAQPASALTVIPAPTSTPRFVTPSPVPISPTPPPTNTPLPGTIALNTYVQITGTGGDGLRLRVSPALSSDPLFLGYDSEVFLVTGGPSQEDGYTWWFLTAPYDQTRSGWAVVNYLTYVPSP